MDLRGGFWRAAQLVLAAIFVLMGVYGGDLPLGALCASIVVGSMSRPTAPGRHRAAAGAALARVRERGVLAAMAVCARSMRRRLAGLLTSWALLLVTVGRSTATLAGVLSAYLAFTVATAGYQNYRK